MILNLRHKNYFNNVNTSIYQKKPFNVFPINHILITLLKMRITSKIYRTVKLRIKDLNLTHTTW